MRDRFYDLILEKVPRYVREHRNPDIIVSSTEDDSGQRTHHGLPKISLSAENLQCFGLHSDHTDATSLRDAGVYLADSRDTHRVVTSCSYRDVTLAY